MYICKNVYLYLDICMDVYMYGCIYVWMCAYIYINNICIFVYTCICVSTYIRGTDQGRQIEGIARNDQACVLNGNWKLGTASKNIFRGHAKRSKFRPLTCGVCSRVLAVSRLEKPDDLPECPSPTVRLPNEQESQPTISLMLFFLRYELGHGHDGVERPAEIEMFWDKRMNQEVLVFGAIQSPYFTHLTQKFVTPMHE